MPFKVTTVCRVRPLVNEDYEKLHDLKHFKNNPDLCIYCKQDGQTIKLSTVGKSGKAITSRYTHYRADYCLDTSSSQTDTYNRTLAPYLDGFLQQGQCIHLITSGATLTGKTYTLFGTSSKYGIVHYVLRDILAFVQRCEDQLKIAKLYLSYYTIYGNEVYDLLSLNDLSSKKPPVPLELLSPKAFPGNTNILTMMLPQLKQYYIADQTTAYTLVKQGLLQTRQLSQYHGMKSSRCHSVLVLTLDTEEENEETHHDDIDHNKEEGGEKKGLLQLKRRMMMISELARSEILDFPSVPVADNTGSGNYTANDVNHHHNINSSFDHSLLPLLPTASDSCVADKGNNNSSSNNMKKQRRLLQQQKLKSSSSGNYNSNISTTEHSTAVIPLIQQSLTELQEFFLQYASIKKKTMNASLFSCQSALCRLLTPTLLSPSNVSRVCLLGTIQPCAYAYSETLSTVQYLHRLREIQIKRSTPTSHGNSKKRTQMMNDNSHHHLLQHYYESSDDLFMLQQQQQQRQYGQPQAGGYQGNEQEGVVYQDQDHDQDEGGMMYEEEGYDSGNYDNVSSAAVTTISTVPATTRHSNHNNNNNYLFSSSSPARSPSPPPTPPPLSPFSHFYDHHPFAAQSPSSSAKKQLHYHDLLNVDQPTSEKLAQFDIKDFLRACTLANRMNQQQQLPQSVMATSPSLHQHHQHFYHEPSPAKNKTPGYYDIQQPQFPADDDKQQLNNDSKSNWQLPQQQHSTAVGTEWDDDDQAEEETVEDVADEEEEELQNILTNAPTNNNHQEKMKKKVKNASVQTFALFVGTNQRQYDGSLDDFKTFLSQSNKLDAVTQTEAAAFVESSMCNEEEQRQLLSLVSLDPLDMAYLILELQQKVALQEEQMHDLHKLVLEDHK